jgi:predicted kinase
MPFPTLIVVSGTPGSGKTTLAHEIARRIGCPAICRDEIKEGIVHAAGGEQGEWGGPVSKRTVKAFYDTIDLLLRSRVSLVAEAAFQRALAQPDLQPLMDIADLRIVHCAVEPAVARARIERRLASDHPARFVSHRDGPYLEALDAGTMSIADFDPVALDVPTLRVDTTDGYHPSIEQIVDFINRT